MYWIHSLSDNITISFCFNLHSTFTYVNNTNIGVSDGLWHRHCGQDVEGTYKKIAANIRQLLIFLSKHQFHVMI